jgi:hypothetical protein
MLLASEWQRISDQVLLQIRRPILAILLCMPRTRVSSPPKVYKVVKAEGYNRVLQDC